MTGKNNLNPNLPAGAHIAIIGAGPSGLASAHVLSSLGYQVSVFEKAPDIGGVWSHTRRYPNVSTQDDRISYAFSDFPMPVDYPTYPKGAQVRAYLQAYAEAKGLVEKIQLNTTVKQARLLDAGVSLTIEHAGATRAEYFDYLIVANGTFSAAHVPAWPGQDAFINAGGRIIAPSELGDGESLDDEHVVVIGWGKTACDIAAAAAHRAASATVVARRIQWKHPKRITERIGARHLLLTRVGEHVLSAPARRLQGRVVRRLTRAARARAFKRLASEVSQQLGLEQIGLLPQQGYGDSNALVSDGFFEAIHEGSLRVKREARIVALDEADGQPIAILSTGERIPADVVIPATGYEQVLDFFDDASLNRLLEADGDLVLHNGIQPTRAQHVAFIGWLHVFHSPLTAEMQAWWLAARLALGREVKVRPDDLLRYRLTHARAAAAGASQLPSGTFGLFDDMLADIGAALPLRTRLRQLTEPLSPSDYRHVLPRLIKQQGARR
jgi:dimethylaniline monooxygenase (N-oxide forming)